MVIRSSIFAMRQNSRMSLIYIQKLDCVTDTGKLLVVLLLTGLSLTSTDP